MKTTKKILVALAAVAGLVSVNAHAALMSFQTYTGSVGVSTDGWGSTTSVGTIQASVPFGSTVLAAYLYTSTFGGLSGAGGTLAGLGVTYAGLGVNGPACCTLEAGRADVTSIIKPLIDGGPGGVYTFGITEAARAQDGEALVVVFSNPTLGTSTVGILDGWASVTGDTTSVNFTSPLHPAAPGFKATMALGIGFSFDFIGCTGSIQTSEVTVNGTTITRNAGCNDDSADFTPANSNLITVGSFDDPFSPLLPLTAADHEFYNLVSQITDGDTTITVKNTNASKDDNIFLAVFDVTGVAGIDEPPPSNNAPEPTSLALAGLALAGLAAQRRRARSA